MQFDSMLNYVRVAMASVMLATLGTAAQAQDLPSFMAPIAGRTDTTYCHDTTTVLHESPDPTGGVWIKLRALRQQQHAEP